MPNWIAFDSDVQAAIYNELCGLHELGQTDNEPEAVKLRELIQREDFWKVYVGPMLDRICEDAGLDF